jgi:hypothetical protein
MLSVNALFIQIRGDGVMGGVDIGIGAEVRLAGGTLPSGAASSGYPA